MCGGVDAPARKLAREDFCDELLGVYIREFAGQGPPILSSLAETLSPILEPDSSASVVAASLARGAEVGKGND